MKTFVISLGGSLIVPDDIDFKFINKFKESIIKQSKKNKFVIVCGGGSIARKYIDALRHESLSPKELAMAGIRTTRINALFLMQIFGNKANSTLPLDIKAVESHLNKRNIVICGALRFRPDSTSDGTAARIAMHLGSSFINMTNVKGLFTSNPSTNKDAKFIPKISWAEFEKMALALKFKAGQHFVLDQEAAVIIRKQKIRTYIIGKDTKALQNIISEKEFVGTDIYG